MRRLCRALVVPLVAGLFLMSSAMSCAANPVKTALKATPENRAETVAFALHNSAIVVAEHAITVAEDSTTPRAVRKALVASVETASPALKKLHSAALAVRRAREAYQATPDSSTAGKLSRLLDALGAAIDYASPRVNALSVEVAAATKVGGGL